MKNTLTKILTLVLALLCSLSLLVGCDATVDEDAFRKALTDALSNVTMDVEYTSESMSYSRTVKSVDGKTYLEGDDGKWIETTSAKSFFLVIGAIAKHYDAFTFVDGAYQAESLHLVDEEEHYTDISNVKITFDLRGNAKSISFDEVSANGNAGTHIIKLSSHGTTTAPENVDNGGGTSTDGGNDVSGENDSYGNVIDGDGMDVTEGNKGDPSGDMGDGTLIPDVTVGAEVDDKKWNAAFSLLYELNYSAIMNSSSPDGDFRACFIVADGIAYYSTDKESWTKGAIEGVTNGISPFVEYFAEFEYDGYRYYCDTLEFDGYSVTDISIVFDSEGRIVNVNHTLVLNGECGTTDISIFDYNVAVAPDGLSGGSSSEGNLSGGNVNSGDDSSSETPDKVIIGDRTEDNFSK
ncbi:MAG: hypothetical protein IJX92_03305 [Clostridia bacterium]|nr:hypothetical protein [Clostridia bacterium]